MCKAESPAGRSQFCRGFPSQHPLAEACGRACLVDLTSPRVSKSSCSPIQPVPEARLTHCCATHATTSRGKYNAPWYSQLWGKGITSRRSIKACGGACLKSPCIGKSTRSPNDPVSEVRLRHSYPKQGAARESPGAKQNLPGKALVGPGCPASGSCKVPGALY